MNLIKAMNERHSVRDYQDAVIPQDVREKLDTFARKVNEESGLSITIEYDEPAGFKKGFAGYGFIKNVKNYIVFKGADSPDFEERIGYYGEMVVLYAQMLGLNTCWAALTFNKKLVKSNTPDGERFSMVAALGYGVTPGTPHKGKSCEDVTGDIAVLEGADAPDWFVNGVEAALGAPTAVNQQKFLIGLKKDDAGELVPTFEVSGRGFYTKVDLGIVRCHFDIGAGKLTF